MERVFRTRAAAQAAAAGYDDDYVNYLNTHGVEMHDYFLARGDAEQAERMLTQTLGEALQGNDGD